MATSSRVHLIELDIFLQFDTFASHRMADYVTGHNIFSPFGPIFSRKQRRDDILQRNIVL